MNDEELRQRMECCRPGPEGQADAEWSALREVAEQDPEVRRQLDAIQDWDAAIGRAMRDVVAPQAMADRLLQALDSPEADAATDRQAVGRASRRWWRTRATRWAVAAASLAAVVALMIHLTGWNDNLTASRVAQAARSWTAQLDPEAWQREAPPTDQYPVDPSLRFAMVGWQRFSALGDSQAVVYQAVVPPDRSRAYLFVIHTRSGRLLPDRPPPMPDSTTGNLCIGSWRSNARVYVLVVPGTRENYRRLIPTRAIAHAISGGHSPVERSSYDARLR